MFDSSHNRKRGPLISRFFRLVWHSLKVWCWSAVGLPEPSMKVVDVRRPEAFPLLTSPTQVFFVDVMPNHLTDEEGDCLVQGVVTVVGSWTDAWLPSPPPPTPPPPLLFLPST